MRILIGVLLASACLGQEFEVVSIKPNRTMSGSSQSHSNQGMLTATNLSLKTLLVRAYGIKNYQLEGPEWLSSEHFDISAKFPESLPSGPGNREKYAAAMQSMMQKMLADRFKVSVHRDRKTLPVYGLVVGKSGIKFKEVPLGGSSSNSNNTHYTGTSISMDDFASFLSGQADMPVVNTTELKGFYDLKLDWFPESRRPEKADADTPAGPILADALQEQLGLKLERRKMPIEIVVVDHAERVPTEN